MTTPVPVTTIEDLMTRGAYPWAGGVGPGNPWVNGGNSFGGAATLGTLDAFAVSLFAKGAPNVFLTSDGTVTTLGALSGTKTANVAAGSGGATVKAVNGPVTVQVTDGPGAILIDNSTNASDPITISAGTLVKVSASGAVEIETLDGVSIANAYASPDVSAKLDIQATDRGFLMPRMTSAQRGAIATPAAGLEVFDTDNALPMVNVGSSVTPVWAAAALKLILTAVKTAAYNANIGELVQADPTVVGTFVVTLPAIAAGSKGLFLGVSVSGNPTIGGATPQNVVITATGTNTIGGGAAGGSVTVSGRGTVLFESDGAGNWIIVKEPTSPSQGATLGAGDQPLTRLGRVTRFVAPTALGGASTYTFSNTGAVSGDLAYVSLPTHDANTLTVKSAGGTTLATWAATIANGGLFEFNGAQWEAVIPGNSTS